MKHSLALLSILAGVLTVAARVDGLDAATERKALRDARGLYGKIPGVLVPNGRFVGKVGNDYNEHASVLLVPRSGRGQTTLQLRVWNGAYHTTRFVALTAKVRSGGRIVEITGGRVSGKGLLPYGIRVTRGRAAGTVRHGAGKPRYVSRFTLSGIDLTKANAPVRGVGTFRGRKG